MDPTGTDLAPEPRPYVRVSGLVGFRLLRPKIIITYKVCVIGDGDV